MRFVRIGRMRTRWFLGLTGSREDRFVLGGLRVVAIAVVDKAGNRRGMRFVFAFFVVVVAVGAIVLVAAIVAIVVGVDRVAVTLSPDVTGVGVNRARTVGIEDESLSGLAVVVVAVAPGFLRVVVFLAVVFLAFTDLTGVVLALFLIRGTFLLEEVSLKVLQGSSSDSLVGLLEAIAPRSRHRVVKDGFDFVFGKDGSFSREIVCHLIKETKTVQEVWDRQSTRLTSVA